MLTTSSNMKESVPTAHMSPAGPQASSLGDITSSTSGTSNTTTTAEAIARIEAWTPELKAVYVRIVLSKQQYKTSEQQDLHASSNPKVTDEGSLSSSVGPRSLGDRTVSRAGFDEEDLTKVAKMPVTAKNTNNSRTSSQKQNDNQVFDWVDSSYGAEVDEVSSVETMTLLSEEEMHCSVASSSGVSGAMEVQQQQHQQQELAGQKHSFSMMEYSGVGSDSVEETEDTSSATCWTSSDGEHEVSCCSEGNEFPPGILATQDACWIPVSEDMTGKDDEDEEERSTNESSLTASTSEKDEFEDDGDEAATDDGDGVRMSSDDAPNALVAAMLKDTVTKEDLELTVSLHSNKKEEEQQRNTTPIKQYLDTKTTNHNAASQQEITAAVVEVRDARQSSNIKSNETAERDVHRDNEVTIHEIKAVATQYTSKTSYEPVVVVLSQEENTRPPVEANVVRINNTSQVASAKPSVTNKGAPLDPDPDTLENDLLDLDTDDIERGPVDLDSGERITLSWTIASANPVDKEHRSLETSTATEFTAVLKTKRERAVFAESVEEAKVKSSVTDKKATDKVAPLDPDTDTLENGPVDLDTATVEQGPVDLDSGERITVSWTIASANPVHKEQRLRETSTATEFTAALKAKRERAAFAESVEEAKVKSSVTDKKATDTVAPLDPDTDTLENGPVDLDTATVEQGPVDLDSGERITVSWTIASANPVHKEQRLRETSTATEFTAALKAKRERAVFAEAVAEALTEKAYLRVPLFCEFQTREQQLSDVTLRSMPLEAVLLRRFDLGFQEAASLVSDARIQIGASKWEPWTVELYNECEMLHWWKCFGEGQAKDMAVITEWPKFLTPGHCSRAPIDGGTVSSSDNSAGSAASPNFESSTGWSSVWDDSEEDFSFATHDREDEYSVRVIREIQQTNQEPEDIATTKESSKPRKTKLLEHRQKEKVTTSRAIRPSSMVIETGNLGITLVTSIQNTDDSSKDLSEISNMSEKLNTYREPKQEQMKTKAQQMVARATKQSPPKPSSAKPLSKSSSAKSTYKRGFFSALGCCSTQNAVVL